MELLEESRRTAQHVERIRALRFAAVPPAVRAGEPARREAAERRVAAADATSSLAARGRAWEDLGLGGPASPRRLLGALALDIQGVALDREGRKVLVDPSFLTAEDFAPKEGEDAGSVLLLATGVRRDEPPLAHVLVHALQRGRTGADPLAGTTDAALAASAWAEGEANLVAIFYLLEGLGLEGQVLEKTLDPGQWLDGALLPASMDVLPGVEAFFMDFVYREGYAQAVGAFRTSGWKGVDRSVAGRRTTRDLLHPDRPPLAVAAIADPPAPNGWILADRDSLGEEGIVALVSILSGKDNLGLMAGDGWAGDALLRFESQAGSASRRRADPLALALDLPRGSRGLRVRGGALPGGSIPRCRARSIRASRAADGRGREEFSPLAERHGGRPRGRRRKRRCGVGQAALAAHS